MLMNYYLTLHSKIMLSNIKLEIIFFPPPQLHFLILWYHYLVQHKRCSPQIVTVTWKHRGTQSG